MYYSAVWLLTHYIRSFKTSQQTDNLIKQHINSKHKELYCYYLIKNIHIFEPNIFILFNMLFTKSILFNICIYLYIHSPIPFHSTPLSSWLCLKNDLSCHAFRSRINLTLIHSFSSFIQCFFLYISCLALHFKKCLTNK